MILNMLKKDLKRKKTMNAILLLFVIMCSMFAAASINNIAAVTGGIESYFDKAEVPDMTANIQPGDDFEDKVRALPSVSSVKSSDAICLVSSKDLSYKGRKMDNFINPPYLVSARDMAVKYFDENDRLIKSVPKGCFYATAPFLQKLDISVGDEFELNVGESRLPLKYMGRFKNPLSGNDDSSSPYILMNEEDYEYISREPKLENFKVRSLYINVSDPDDVRAIAKDTTYLTTREEHKSLYLYDMLSAYIMLAISIVLLVTVFVVLRFTIGFTISEEFREIGVMKAVGIGNGSIRSLYIVKYLAIAAVGAFIGFFCSVPMSRMMMKNVTKNMVLASENSILMGAVSSVAVVVIILLFCYGCTRRIKKLSPIDAVRNGQTGERFKKKSFMHLGCSKLPSTAFMSLNDVLSAPKRFAVITLIFTLCMLMMTLMSVFSLTLKSEKILWLFDVPSSDAHIADIDYYRELLDDFGSYDTILDKAEKMLSDNGIPGKCSTCFGTVYEATYKDKKANLWFFVTKGEKNDLFRCSEGYAPRKTDEIAMTGYAMEDLGVGIGDRIKTVIGDKEYEFLITGRFYTFQGSGHAVQVHPDLDLVKNDSISTVGIQVIFDGDPDQATVDKNIEIIKKAIDSDKVFNTVDMIEYCTQMSDTLAAIKLMMMILTVIVTAMIVILMERSFISKEKSEIALMKAVGISNRSIVTQHALRFVIVSVLACIISLAVLMPIGNALMNYICSMIGDVSDIKCAVDPVDVFIVCPLVLIGITVIGSFLTALYTKAIKASDTASIE